MGPNTPVSADSQLPIPNRIKDVLTARGDMALDNLIYNANYLCYRYALVALGKTHCPVKQYHWNNNHIYIVYSISPSGPSHRWEEK